MLTKMAQRPYALALDRALHCFTRFVGTYRAECHSTRCWWDASPLSEAGSSELWFARGDGSDAVQLLSSDDWIITSTVRLDSDGRIHVAAYVEQNGVNGTVVRYLLIGQ